MDMSIILVFLTTCLWCKLVNVQFGWRGDCCSQQNHEVYKSIVTNGELYASVFYSCFAGHAFLTTNLNQTTRLFPFGAWMAWFIMRHFTQPQLQLIYRNLVWEQEHTHDEHKLHQVEEVSQKWSGHGWSIILVPVPMLKYSTAQVR